jgi:hypothetical protein
MVAHASDFRAAQNSKARVAAGIVQLIRCQEPLGRFLKQDPDRDGAWYDIGDVLRLKR